MAKLSCWNSMKTALTNVKNQPQIKDSVAEVGCDDAVIAQGDHLLQETRAAVDRNQLEDVYNLKFGIDIILCH